MSRLFKNTIKVFLIVVFFIFLTVPLYALNIAVVKSHDLEPYSDAVLGFEQEINKNKKPGDIDFFYYNLEKDGVEKIKESIKLEKTDLIFTLGSEATKELKERINDIPIVFCLVLDPVKNGLIKTKTSSGNNLAGVDLDIPVKTQFKYLKDMNPDINRVGVIYDPLNSDLTIREAETAASDLGLRLVKKIVSSPKEVPVALDSIKGSIDALWGLVDTTVFTTNAITYILKFTLDTKIPFLGFSVKLVEAGALLGVYADYRDLGRQAGEIALRIFLGESPSQIPLYYPRKALVAVNLIVANFIKTNVSDQFINKADKVFK